MQYVSRARGASFTRYPRFIAVGYPYKELNVVRRRYRELSELSEFITRKRRRRASEESDPVYPTFINYPLNGFAYQEWLS